MRKQTQDQDQYTVPVTAVEIGDIVDPFVLAVKVKGVKVSNRVVHLIGANGMTLEVPAGAKVEVAA